MPEDKKNKQGNPEVFSMSELPKKKSSPVNTNQNINENRLKSSSLQNELPNSQAFNNINKNSFKKTPLQDESPTGIAPKVGLNEEKNVLENQKNKALTDPLKKEPKTSSVINQPNNSDIINFKDINNDKNLNSSPNVEQLEDSKDSATEKNPEGTAATEELLQDAADVAGKVGGGWGKVASVAAKTKLGKAVIKNASKKLNEVTGGKVDELAKTLKDSGATDVAKMSVGAKKSPPNPKDIQNANSRIKAGKNNTINKPKTIDKSENNPEENNKKDLLKKQALNKATSKIPGLPGGIKTKTNENGERKIDIFGSLPTPIKIKIALTLTGAVFALFFLILIISIISVVINMLVGFEEEENTANYYGNVCTYNIEGEEVTDIKVELINCGATNLSNSEVIETLNFEEYIAGVVYAEIGTSFLDETIKTQAIAARSYALSRQDVMCGGSDCFVGYNKETNVVRMRMCENDQAYCSLTQGCERSDVGGVAEWSQGLNGVYSTYHQPLTGEELTRFQTLVSSVAGLVLTDETGTIINTRYLAEDQLEWEGLANQGYDYEQILKNHYGINNILNTANCYSNVGAINGDLLIQASGMVSPMINPVVTSEFGPRKSFQTDNGDWTNPFHGGIDLVAGGTGEPIYAIKPGTVLLASYAGGYGNCVQIDHGNGILSVYAHLNAIRVSVGDTVAQAQHIGDMGATGDVTGPHLHFEIRINNEKQNPRNFIQF